MKISEITTHVLGTPWRDLTYVQVHTDEGLVGVGETRMLGHTEALLGYLKEAERNHIAGSDPFDVESLVRRMKYGDYGRAGEIVMSGIATVEMACWDIMGKALGQPVWRLLGGRYIGHIGGILETRKLAATAETHDVMIAPHNVGGAVLTAANLHLAACTPNFKIQEHFNDFADEGVKQAAPGLPAVVDGHFDLPTAPGLGVELDVDFVAEHPTRHAHFDLYAQDWHKREG